MMMTMFATIFQMTGTFVHRAERDRGERSKCENPDHGSENRPGSADDPATSDGFHPNMFLDVADQSDDARPAQQGYLYVSENDPTDDTDDVLQFTINMANGNSGLSQFNNPAVRSYLYGRGLFLVPPWQSGANYAAGAVVRPSTSAAATPRASLLKGARVVTDKRCHGADLAHRYRQHRYRRRRWTWTTIAILPLDQPDGDDEQIVFANGSPTLNPPGGSQNNTGASQYAEVTYFLRHGNLYRRVLLIRQPLQSDCPALVLLHSRTMGTGGL